MIYKNTSEMKHIVVTPFRENFSQTTMEIKKK